MQIVNLGEIAKEAAERMRPLAEKQGIALAVEGDDSLVTGARALLEEMVRNLVDNAIKYNVEKGSVRVSVKNGCLTVEDTGIGVDQQDQQKIFGAVLPRGKEPFPRGGRHRAGPVHREAHRTAAWRADFARQ